MGAAPGLGHRSSGLLQAARVQKQLSEGPATRQTEREDSQRAALWCECGPGRCSAISPSIPGQVHPRAPERLLVPEQSVREQPE
jgi:hypothetical protein